MILSDATSIWSADWSQFIPDAILTVVTGAAIGWALWRLQRGAESRAEKRGGLAAWSVARSQVAWAVSDEIDDYKDADSWLGVWDQTSYLVKEHSGLAVGEWSNAAPKDEELRLTKALMTDVPQLRRVAVELDDLLKRALMRDGNMTDGPVPMFLELAWVKVRQLDPARGLRRGQVDQLTEHVDRALSYPDVRAKATDYMIIERRVKDTYARLRAFLTS